MNTLSLIIIQAAGNEKPQDKPMQVCGICGALLVVGDTDKRTSSHLEGKQHQGFELIRTTVDEYRVLFFTHFFS